MLLALTSEKSSAPVEFESIVIYNQSQMHAASIYSMGRRATDTALFQSAKASIVSKIGSSSP